MKTKNKVVSRTLINNILLVVLLISLLVFISGEQGCDIGKQTNAQTSGIGFNLVSGNEMLSSGQTLQQTQTFKINVEIQNYGSPSI